MKLRQIFDNRISCLIIDINIENFSLTYILITKKFSIIDINYRLITSLNLYYFINFLNHDKYMINLVYFFYSFFNYPLVNDISTNRKSGLTLVLIVFFFAFNFKIFVINFFQFLSKYH